MAWWSGGEESPIYIHAVQGQSGESKTLLIFQDLLLPPEAWVRIKKPKD